MPINRIFELLQKTLAIHGAKQILFEYGNDGKIYGLTFVIKLNDRLYPIKMPTRIENVKKVLLEQGFNYDDEQIYRVAWKNVLAWIEAQMAFIDIGQTKLEEVFLSHFTDQSGKTYFERMESKNFLLEGGE